MQVAKTIAGNSTEEVWQQLQADFDTLITFSDYSIQIEQENHHIELSLGVHQGGSEEGGYEYTTLTAPLSIRNEFFFSIYPQDVFTEIGKLLGLEDITTGYTEFDDQVIVKTNDPDKFRHVFSSKDTRQVFETLSSYSFQLATDKSKDCCVLDLKIQRAITDSAELKRIYRSFYQVLVLSAYINQ